MKRRTIAGRLGVILTIVGAGCSVINEKAGTYRASLDSGKWILLSLNGQEVKASPEQPLYLEFNVTDQKVSGYGGCNRIFGAYTVESSKLAFARISSTKLMCPALPTEAALMAGLQRVNRYQIEGEKLLLLAGNEPVAILRVNTQ